MGVDKRRRVVSGWRLYSVVVVVVASVGSRSKHQLAPVDDGRGRLADSGLGTYGLPSQESGARRCSRFYACSWSVDEPAGGVRSLYVNCLRRSPYRAKSGTARIVDDVDLENRTNVTTHSLAARRRRCERDLVELSLRIHRRTCYYCCCSYENLCMRHQ